MVDITNDPDCPRAGRHRELEKAVVNEGEESVQRVIGVVRDFTNPFTIADKNRLHYRTSGAPLPMEIEIDVWCSELELRPWTSSKRRARKLFRPYQEEEDTQYHGDVQQ